MPYRYRLNPALINDYGYFSFPVLGNVAIGVNSNMALSKFLYPRGNELVTGLHPSIPADEFLGGLKNKNNLDLDIDMTLLSFGFFAFNGFNTFDISLKSQTSIYLPKDLFTFLKTGQGDGGPAEYDFGNIAAGSYDFDSQKTEPTETTVQIKIIEVNGSNALKRLDGLELKIEGGLGDQNKGTEGGVP